MVTACRPNIGLRGQGRIDRPKLLSSKTEFLGGTPPIYLHPRPIISPLRGGMNAVEIIQSLRLLKYGPHTTAGAIQFFLNPNSARAIGPHDLLLSDHNALDHPCVGRRAKAFKGLNSVPLVGTLQGPH